MFFKSTQFFSSLLGNLDTLLRDENEEVFLCLALQLWIQAFSLTFNQLLFGRRLAVWAQELYLWVGFEHEEVKTNALWMIPLTFIFTEDVLVVVVLLCANTIPLISMLWMNSQATLIVLLLQNKAVSWKYLPSIVTLLAIHSATSSQSVLSIRTRLILVLLFVFDHEHLVGGMQSLLEDNWLSWKGALFYMLFMLFLAKNDANLTSFESFIAISVSSLNIVHLRRFYVDGIKSLACWNFHHLAQVFPEKVVEVLFTLNFLALLKCLLDLSQELHLILLFE